MRIDVMHTSGATGFAVRGRCLMLHVPGNRGYAIGAISGLNREELRADPVIHVAVETLSAQSRIAVKCPQRDRNGQEILAQRNKAGLLIVDLREHYDFAGGAVPSEIQVVLMGKSGDSARIASVLFRPSDRPLMSYAPDLPKVEPQSIPEQEDALTVAVESFATVPADDLSREEPWRMVRSGGYPHGVKYGITDDPVLGRCVRLRLAEGHDPYRRCLPYPNSLPEYFGADGGLWRDAKALLLDLSAEAPGELTLTLAGATYAAKIRKGAQRLAIPIARSGPTDLGIVVERGVGAVRLASLKVRFDNAKALDRYHHELTCRRIGLLKRRQKIIDATTDTAPQAIRTKLTDASPNTKLDELAKAADRVNRWQQAWDAYQLGHHWLRRFRAKLAAQPHPPTKTSLDEVSQQLTDVRQYLSSGRSEEASSLAQKALAKLDATWRVFEPVWNSKPRTLTTDGSMLVDYDGRKFMLCGGYWGMNDKDTYLSVVDDPASFSAIFEPYLRMMTREGYNVLRLPVEPQYIMPTEGAVDERYMTYLRWVTATADKYGILVDLDMHFFWPDWVKPGKGNGAKADPYDEQDVLCEMWRIAAKNLAPLPNVVTSEVPVNEPIFHIGIMKSKKLLQLWNAYLVRKYRTRENLAEAWRGVIDGAPLDGLGQQENPAEGTVEVPGFCKIAWQNDPEMSSRLRDYFEWHVNQNITLCERIVGILNAAAPGRNIIHLQQPLVGAVYDHGPLPIGLNDGYLQSVARGAVAGMHGTLYNDFYSDAIAPKIRHLGTFCAESETLLDPRAVRSLWKDNGISLYFFNYRIHTGRWGYFANCSGDVEPTMSFMAPQTSWFINAPLARDNRRIVVILNSRLAAVHRSRVLSEIAPLLDGAGIGYNIVESHTLWQHPHALDRYRLGIVSTDYLDERLLPVLKSTPCELLLYGVLDASARGGKLNRELARDMVIARWFLKSVPPIETLPGRRNAISLEGLWKAKFFPGQFELPSKSLSAETDTWMDKMIVGRWGSAGLPASLNYPIGTGLYRRVLTLPDTWRGRSVYLDLGKVDEMATVYANGRRLSRQQSRTAGVTTYELTPDFTRSGTLELAIAVTNRKGDGGVLTGPVRLRTRLEKKYAAGAPGSVLRPAGWASVPRQDNIKPEAFRPGCVKYIDDEGFVWLAEDGNKHLWLGPLPQTVSELRASGPLETIVKRGKRGDNTDH